MRTLKRIATTIAIGALLSVGLGVGTAQAKTIGNCPEGYLCIYEDAYDWSVNKVEHMYYDYGFHALWNEWGPHWHLNNQTDNARVFLCVSTDLSSCYELTDWGWNSIELGPINYILLTDKYGGF